MMRRGVIPLAATLCLGSDAVAQVPVQVPSAPGRVVGSVVATTSGEPIAAAAITVYSAGDTTAFTFVMSTEAGKFRIEGLPFGRYTLRVSQVGYTPLRVPEFAITPQSATHDAGVLKLEVSAVQLDALEANVQRSPIILEADRTVYDTKQMPAAAGGTAADLLRSVDELEVDFNGKVSLRGNISVAVHINGRPAPMRGEALEKFLSQMPGRMVSKIEVIPNPSAKHDPEGMGGIVNIVLKDNVDLGLSGSFGLNVDSRGSRGINARLAWQKGRFTFFGGGSANLSDDNSDMHDLRQSLLTDPSLFIEQDGDNRQEARFGFGDFSAEFRLTPKTIVWANGYASGNGADTRGSTLYGIWQSGAGSQAFNPVTDQYVEHYYRRVTADYAYGFGDVGIGLKHQIQPQRHELVFDVRHYFNTGHNNQHSEKESLLEENAANELTLSDHEADNRGTTVKLDYFRPLGQRGRLDVGGSVYRRTTDEVTTLDVYASETAIAPLSAMRSGFLHEENMRSLYLTLAQGFGNFNISAGVRGEFATTTFSLDVTGQEYDNDYNSVFPNVNVSYQLGAGKTMRVGYSKRIGRPPTFYLNPYRPTVDPLNRIIGNPELGPNYTHSVNADFSWIGSRGTLRIAPYYRETVDNWDQIKTVDSTGVSTVTYRNVASVRQVGSNFTVGLRPQGRFGGTVSFSVFHTRNDATNIDTELSREAWRWSLGGNLSMKLTETLNATANATYMPPRDLPQGRYGSMTFSTLGLRQQLFNQKATLNLFMQDPLNLYRFEFTTSDRTHVQLSRTTPRMRRINLSVSYNFGRPPQQNSRREDQNVTGDSGVIR